MGEGQQSSGQELREVYQRGRSYDKERNRIESGRQIALPI